MPLTPPHSSKNEAAKNAAFEAVEKIKPKHLSVVDSKLWECFENIELALAATGGNPLEAFQRFLEEDYFPMMIDICDEEVHRTQSLTPPFLPELFATIDEKSKRLQVLSKATLAESDQAEEVVKEDYINFSSSLKAAAKKFLPMLPPMKFFTEHYY